MINFSEKQKNFLPFGYRAKKCHEIFVKPGLNGLKTRYAHDSNDGHDNHEDDKILVLVLIKIMIIININIVYAC